MDNKDSKINQIISHLASAAAVAADGVTDLVQNAGNAVGDRYNSVKVSFGLTRLQEEQRKLFTEIGRTHFLLETGAVETAGSSVSEAQEILDRLMEKAGDKQREIDDASARLNDLSGRQVCPACGKGGKQRGQLLLGLRRKIAGKALQAGGQRGKCGQRQRHAPRGWRGVRASRKTGYNADF